MKVLLDVRDNKAPFVMKMLENYSFIKAKAITPQKAEILEELKEAIENVNLVKQGKMKARSAKDLLNEL